MKGLIKLIQSSLSSGNLTIAAQKTTAELLIYPKLAIFKTLAYLANSHSQYTYQDLKSRIYDGFQSDVRLGLGWMSWETFYYSLSNISLKQSHTQIDFNNTLASHDSTPKFVVEYMGPERIISVVTETQILHFICKNSSRTYELVHVEKIAPGLLICVEPLSNIICEYCDTHK